MPPERGTVVLLSDGKERPLERPKRKNIKHIFPTTVCLTEEMMKTNRSLKHALRDIRREL